VAELVGLDAELARASDDELAEADSEDVAVDVGSEGAAVAPGSVD
jgi:hypothetical protein